MRIDPNRLVRLAVLVEAGNFRRAADRLGLTQPALSQSIAQLEQEVGIKLIDRTPHGIEPTLYGKVLCESAKAIDRELAVAAQQIQELAFGHKGTLTIGVSSGGAASLVALGICRLQESRAGIDMRIVEEASFKSLMAQLQDRTLDMLICQRPPEADLKGARTLSMFQARRVACVRRGHPLRENIKLKELALYPFVCPQENVGLLMDFRQIFSTIGRDLPEVLVSNSVHIAKDIVMNSDSFGLFSDLSVIQERRLGLMNVVELDIQTRYWLQLVVRCEQTPTDLMRAFVAEALAVCGHLEVPVHADIAKLSHARR